MMKLVNIILAGLTFNKSKLVEIGKEEEYNLVAWILILALAVLEGIISYIIGKAPGHSGFARESLAPELLLVVVPISSLIGTVLLAVFLQYTLKLLFKCETTTSGGIVRLVGAITIWKILGAFVVFLPESVSMLGAILWLISIIVLLVGLTFYSEQGWIKTFVSIVIGIILVFITTYIFSYIVSMLTQL